MASKQSQAVRAMYAKWTATAAAGEESDLEEWGNLTAEPRGVDYLEVDAGGVPAMWAGPKDSTTAPVIVSVHGGGYIGGSMYTHRKLYAHLAKAVGARALVVDYRLTPAFRHPAQVEDVTRVYRWLLDQGESAERIAFVGDSAGGSLVLGAQLRARAEGLPLPVASMLISPWVDLELTGDSWDINRDKDPFFHREAIQPLVTLFLGEDGDPRDPSASPLYADLTGLGPIYIQVGDHEGPRDDSPQLAAVARKAGVEVRLDTFPEMQHTFLMMAGRAPEADEAIGLLAKWVRPKLGL
jgi:epsilon-lactone hydrolase